MFLMWSEYFNNVYFIEFEIENVVNFVITSVCLFHLQSFYVLMLVCEVSACWAHLIMTNRGKSNLHIVVLQVSTQRSPILGFQ